MTENIYTIGHSTHSQEEFLHMLAYADIEAVVDVRAFPGSRKFPQFKKSNMEKWLPEAGLDYTHLPHLGGRRQASSDVGVTLNAGWQNDSFHNYADYTLTADFQTGIQDLMTMAKSKRTVYFCSERHPARCHRLIISNWLKAHDWDVKHILDGSKEKVELVSHQLGQWGAMPIIEEDGEIVYPILD